MHHYYFYFLVFKSLDYEVSDNLVYQNEEREKSSKKWVSFYICQNIGVMSCQLFLKVVQLFKTEGDSHCFLMLEYSII